MMAEAYSWVQMVEIILFFIFPLLLAKHVKTSINIEITFVLKQIFKYLTPRTCWHISYKLFKSEGLKSYKLESKLTCRFSYILSYFLSGVTLFLQKQLLTSTPQNVYSKKCCKGHRKATVMEFLFIILQGEK